MASIRRKTQGPLALLAVALAAACHALCFVPSAVACYHADQHREYPIAVSKDERRYATALIILHREEQRGAISGASFYCLYDARSARMIGTCKKVRDYAYPGDVGQHLSFGHVFFVDKIEEVRIRFLRRHRGFRSVYATTHPEVIPFSREPAAWTLSRDQPAWPLGLWGMGANVALFCVQGQDAGKVVCTSAKHMRCKQTEQGCISYADHLWQPRYKYPEMARHVGKFQYVCAAGKTAALLQSITPSTPPTRGRIVAAERAFEYVPPKLGKLVLVQYSNSVADTGNHHDRSDVVVPFDLKRAAPLSVRIVGGAKTKRRARVERFFKKLQIDVKSAKIARSSPAAPRITTQSRFALLGWWMIEQSFEPKEAGQWKVVPDPALDVSLQIELPDR